MMTRFYLGDNTEHRFYKKKTTKPMNSAFNYTKWLADWIMSYILDCLGPRDRIQCFYVCKKWKKLSENEKYWEKMFTQLSNFEMGDTNLPMEEWLYIKQQIEKSWKWLTQLLIYGTRRTSKKCIKFKGSYWRDLPRRGQIREVYLSIGKVDAEDTERCYNICIGDVGNCILLSHWKKYKGVVLYLPQDCDTVLGYGKMEYRNSKIRYEGKWRLGELHGWGSITYEDGKEYGSNWSYGYPTHSIPLLDALNEKKRKWDGCLGLESSSQFRSIYRNLCEYCHTECRGLDNFKNVSIWGLDPTKCECRCKKRMAIK